MATKKKGTLPSSGKRAKHLRKFKKRKFWKGERAEVKKIKNVNPLDDPHPGEILEELYLQPLGITNSQLAASLHISEPSVKNLLKGDLKITNTLASRLSKVFNTSKELWINLQNYYDHRVSLNRPSKPYLKMNQIDLVLFLRSNPLKIAAIISIAKKLNLNQIQTAALADISLRTLKQKSKTSILSANASEKVLKLEELFQIGVTAFDNNEHSFRAWLKSPIPALGNHIPVELITTHLGIDLVRDELLRIEHSVI